MPRWTTLVLAGALGWPAVINAQPWSTRPPTAPPATRPADPAAATTPMPGATAPEAPVVVPAADAATDVAPVPPLPPSGPLPPSVGAGLPPEAIQAKPGGVDELPRATPPVPGAPGVPGVRAPVMSGMPPAKPYQGMPPGTYAPTIPPVCCPTEPPSCTTCNDSGFLAYGDLLVLRARQSNPVAILSRVDNTVPQVSFSEIRQYNTDHVGAWRAGGGYLFENGWIFTTTYTQFKDQTSEQQFLVPALPNSTYTVTYTGPGQLFGTQIGNPGDTISATWNMQLRTIDMLIGTVFSPADCFDLTITGGCRIAWLDQDYRVGINSLGTTTFEDLSLDLAGAGPMLQCEARCYLFPWLAGYSRAMGTLLLANREDVSTVRISDVTGGIQAIRAVSYDREEIVPVFELAVGLEGTLCDGRFTVNGGYEFHYWYELGTSFAAQAGAQAREPNHADISLDGFFLRVTWLF